MQQQQQLQKMFLKGKMLMIHVWPMEFSGKVWSREEEGAGDPKVWFDEFCSLSCLRMTPVWVSTL